MAKGTLRRHARALALGAGLVAIFWAWLTFVAFAIFSREQHMSAILAVAAPAFMLLAWWLWYIGWAGWRTGLYAACAIAGLVVLYMIPLRSELPPPAAQLNAQLSERHEDRYRYARALFYALAQRFTGPVREYLRQPHRVFFIKDPHYYWHEGGYMPSHLQAQLYRNLLLASGRFAPEEVAYRTGSCLHSPHGYVEIAHPQRPIYADLWAVDHFADYRFGQLVEMPDCDRLLDPQPRGLPLDRAAGPLRMAVR